MMPRSKFTHNLKKVLTKANDPVNTKNELYVPKKEIARPDVNQENN